MCMRMHIYRESVKLTCLTCWLRSGLSHLTYILKLLIKILQSHSSVPQCPVLTNALFNWYSKINHCCHWSTLFSFNHLVCKRPHAPVTVSVRLLMVHTLVVVLHEPAVVYLVFPEGPWQLWWWSKVALLKSNQIKWLQLHCIQKGIQEISKHKSHQVALQLRGGWRQAYDSQIFNTGLSEMWLPIT